MEDEILLKFKAACESKDFDSAMTILTPVAELGSAEAHSGLGGYYATGNWGENPELKNEVEAVEHYTEAADHGHIEAQYNLATMILFGEGCDQNTNKAVDLLAEAAHQGQADAPKVLFELYQKGLDGVEKNPEKATYWKKIAKELEDEI